MWIFWDIAIILLIAMHAVIIWYFVKKRAKWAIVLLTLSLLHLLFGSIIEPRRIAIQEQDIMLNENVSAAPLKAALISDLHLGPFKKKSYVEKIHNQLLEINPSIVLIAGDFIYNKRSVPELENIKIITDSFKTFAVLGNHDYNMSIRGEDTINEELADDVRLALKNAGVTVLDNQYSLEVPNNERPIWIVGLDSWTAEKNDIDSAIQGTISSYPKIVLAHSPDVETTINSSHEVDLILAGHTHGGQIRLPLWGAIPKLPILDQRFDKGLFSLEDTQMYVTSGIGEIGPRARLYNPPEIVVLNVYY